MDSDGIKRLSDIDDRDAEIQLLEEEAHDLRSNLIYDEIGASPDPVAKCLEFTDWISPEDCVEEDLLWDVFYAQMIRSDNPMDVCLGYSVRTGWSESDCEYQLDYIDDYRADLQQWRDNLAYLEAEIERISGQGVIYNDDWDIEVTCYEPDGYCDFISSAPVRSQDWGGVVFYIYDSFSNTWVRANPGDAIPM